MPIFHGEAGPLRRIRADDGVAYYSPTFRSTAKTLYGAFTAAAIAADGELYVFTVRARFHP